MPQPGYLILAALLCILTGSANAAGILPLDAAGRPVSTLAPMLEKTMPAVVNINTKTRVKVRDPFANDPFFRHFFGIPNLPRERVEQSLGSGVIVDAKQGYVLTNNHVVQNADDIQVTLADGRTLKGDKVGSDPESDVAVIKISADGLTAVALADSTALRVGDFVVAIGNPFGLGQTVTSGIVSALGRTGLKGLGIQNFIQTDASINPGNSGGALVNLNGELIGINTAIYSPSGGNVGIGFAIPSSLAGQVMRQLLAFGEVKRGSIGIQAQDIDEEIAEMLGLKSTQGIVTTRVIPDSPAEKAGLKTGDVILALNAKPIHGKSEFSSLEGLLPIGSPITLKVMREGKELALTTVLALSSARQAIGEKIDARLAGAVFADLNSSQVRQGFSGARVAKIEPHRRAASNGLQEGDVITAINQRQIEGVADLETALARQPQQILLTVVRNNVAFFLLME